MMKKESEIILCDCAAECVGVKVTRWDDEPDELILTIYWHGDFHQHNSRLRLLYHALTGRPFHVAEMVLDRKKAIKLGRLLVWGR